MAAFDAQFDTARINTAPPQPQPLMAEMGKQPDYPVEALGPVLGDVVRATVDEAFVPKSIAAQSVLAACSLAIQGHFNVKLPTGQFRPTSLFLVTVADSGDRKSTADDLVTAPIHEYEKILEERYARERADAQGAQTAWDESRKHVTHQNKSRGREALEAAYKDLGNRPDGPVEPTIIVRTGTTQGLLKRFLTTRPSLGLMSDEGGSWLGGYGMTEDNRLNTISTLSDFWDGKTIQMMTAGEGFTPLRGRRLTFHMMVQPIVAGRLLGDSEAQGQGFLSRLLVAHPESLAGSRFVDPNTVPDPQHAEAMQAFAERMRRIIEYRLPLLEGTNELQPRAIELDADAQKAWWDFYNGIERRLGPAGDLQGVKGFVGKLPEQTARLAAIIAVFDYGAAIKSIDVVTMRRGIALAEFYLAEALRLFGHAAPSALMQDAQLLSDWLRDTWEENLISVQAISQRGPGRLRKGGDHIRDVVNVLVRHDHLSEQLPSGGSVGGKQCRGVWRVLNRAAQ